MWTYDKALAVVSAYVAAATDGNGMVLEALTIDRPYGWVFFYQSRVFVESGDFRHAYCGNAPVIFNRVNGEYHVTGTARAIEDYIGEYQASLPVAQLEMKPQARTR